MTAVLSAFALLFMAAAALDHGVGATIASGSPTRDGRNSAEVSQAARNAQAVDEEAEEVDIAKLVAVDYQPGKDLPKEIQDLDGKKIVIRGFMDPAQQTPDRLTSFRLVTDSCGCIGKPQVHHYVEVTLKDLDAAFQANIVELEGVLSVGEVEEDGFVTSIYRLEATSIR